MTMSPPDALTRQRPAVLGEPGEVQSTRQASSTPQTTRSLSQPRRIGIVWGDVLDCATTSCAGCGWVPFECHRIGDRP
jgi:hypothetical protein